MKKGKMTSILLAAAAGTAIAFVAAHYGISMNRVALALDSGPFETKLTGSTGPGDALIELTPGIDNNRLVVKFSINSHSVRLGDFDLKDVTLLEYEGKIITPVKAGRIGGHHSSGTMVFETGKDIRSFTIRIKGIPSVNERVYHWDAG